MYYSAFTSTNAVCYYINLNHTQRKLSLIEQSLILPSEGYGFWRIDFLGNNPRFLQGISAIGLGLAFRVFKTPNNVYLVTDVVSTLWRPGLAFR